MGRILTLFTGNNCGRRENDFFPATIKICHHLSPSSLAAELTACTVDGNDGMRIADIISLLSVMFLAKRKIEQLSKYRNVVRKVRLDIKRDIRAMKVFSPSLVTAATAAATTKAVSFSS